MEDTKNSLLLFFDRPSEPVIFPKGPRNAVFAAPSAFLTQRHRVLAPSLADRFGAAPTVPVAEVPVPDVSKAAELPRDVPFSTFVPWHRRLATQLIELFMGASNVEELQALAVAVNERVNPELFAYALAVTILHRPDTRDLQPPNFAQVFPSKFITGEGLMGQARMEANLSATEREPIVIPTNWTATDADPEHRLAYFREDVGINLHHWHWHLVYPFDGPRSIVAKDRRGELFYFMHQQIIARYNIERFAFGMARVRRLGSFRDVIPEGYYSKLDRQLASRGYAGRQNNSFLKDVNRDLERMFFDIKDLERWDARLFDAIHSGAYINDRGERIPLTESEGIDVLGNAIEASVLTPNRALYGDLHNFMHYAFGCCHDPDGRHLELFQAVADPSTSMRDPVFYPMHAYIDDIFREHKNTLPPYSVEELQFNGVAVRQIVVQSEAAPGEAAPPPPGELITFWQQSDLDLSRGLDFAPRGPVYARVTHLQHATFTYGITVENTSGADRAVTVRIFLAPRTDERRIPLHFSDHKNFFVEMDKFAVRVPQGVTVLQRASTQSSLTVPFEQTFRDVDTNRPTEEGELDRFNFCGCGWPQHMLLPRGSVGGLPCLIYVMLTDFEEDRVEDSAEPPLAGSSETPAPGQRRCKEAASFCGLRDRRYPDRRPMGYPFDRMPRDGVSTLDQFMAGFANMAVTNASINLRDAVLVRCEGNSSTPTPVTA